MGTTSATATATAPETEALADAPVEALLNLTPKQEPVTPGSAKPITKSQQIKIKGLCVSAHSFKG